jgi:murein DD-endopeptidase MepM/ murein hydrolase activator NlpD
LFRNPKFKICPEPGRRFQSRNWAWLCFAALLHVKAALGATTDGISWPKRIEVSQGELVEVHVSGGELASVEGMLAGEKITFHETGGGSFSALLGADVGAKPSMAKLRLTARTQSGAERRAEVPVHVLAKIFRQESFNVAPGFDQISPETLEEIRREQAAFARVFASPEPARLWDAPFLRPVPHEASASSFGSRRIINGKPRAPHGGTDLSSPAGTEVAAANHGRVALAGDFFFAGGSIVLDHGGGLFTMYFHLSELRVGEGAMVRKGDVLGLSGATGRVTGAHLHWGARLGNARVDPLQLLEKITGPWPPVVPALAVEPAGEK